MRSKQIQKLIKQALDLCSDRNLSEVKFYLSKALKESKNKEKESQHKKTSALQNWKFNIETSTLSNLRYSQKQNIINQIDNLIEKENKNINKEKQEKSQDLFE